MLHFLDRCKFVLDATSRPQIFSSPGYPALNYFCNEKCTWDITARPGYHVQLQFTDFETEAIYDVVTVSFNCCADLSHTTTIKCFLKIIC